VKTYFDPQVQAELQARLRMLEPGAPARWGRMDAAQMLAHCAVGMKMATGEVQVKRGFPALIGWMFKSLACDDRPFRHDAPTAAELRVADPREFEAERAHLEGMLAKLAPGASRVTNLTHPFFGRLTAEQWGRLLYKHLDHHFRQFGV
jgi:hypothetical protein